MASDEHTPLLKPGPLRTSPPHTPSPHDHDLLATPHLIRAMAIPTPSPSGRPRTRQITFYDRLRYYIPILQWFPVYSIENLLLGDVLAGITVGVMLIPQGIAYATLANIPPIHGLYTAFFPLLVYFFMGSSRQLAVGPEATTAMLIGQMLLRVSPSLHLLDANATPEQSTAAFIGLAGSCGLLSAIITLSLGLLRVGFVQSILSTPILSGFVCAVAMLLIVDQSAKLFGIQPHGMALDATSFDKIVYLYNHIHEIHIPSTCVSIVTITTLLGLRFLKSRYPHQRAMAVLPEVLLVVVAMTIASLLLDLPSIGVVTLGTMSYGFVAPVLPDLSPHTLSRLLPSALTISILGFCTSQLVTKIQSAKYGYRVSPNRELVALGLSNVVGAMFGALPAYGSITRTKVFDSAGGRTPIGLLISASTIFCAIMWLLPWFASMPRAVIASVIMVVAFSIIDVNEIMFLINIGARRDLYMLIAMTAFTFIFGLETGITFAFGSCLLIVVKQTNRPAITMLGRNHGDNEFYDVSAVEFEAENLEGLLIVRVEGPLYFANSTAFAAAAERYEQFGDVNAAPFAIPNPVQVQTVVIDLANMATIDSTGVHVLSGLIHGYLSRGVRVCLIRPRTHVREILDAAGITRSIGASNIFRRLADCVTACEKKPRPAPIAEDDSAVDYMYQQRPTIHIDDSSTVNHTNNHET